MIDPNRPQNALPVLVKGTPIYVHRRARSNGLSDVPVDCRGANAVSIQVLLEGSPTTPSVTIEVEGTSVKGGKTQLLADSQSQQAGISADTQFDVNTGQPWVYVRLASISGTYGANDGWTIIVTPYVAAGQNNVNISNTASQNLAEYLGATASPTNPVDVQLSDGSASIGGAGAPVRVDPTGSTTQPASVADGDDEVAGSTTDAAVTSDANGTLSAKLRGLVAILADVWDSANDVLKVRIGRLQRATATLTIANAATTSDAIDARGYAMFGLVMPAAFTGASITFEVSDDNSTFQALYDQSNVQVSLTVAASRSYDLPVELATWPYWRVVSASAEAAQRALLIVAKG